MLRQRPERTYDPVPEGLWTHKMRLIRQNGGPKAASPKAWHPQRHQGTSAVFLRLPIVPSDIREPQRESPEELL